MLMPGVALVTCTTIVFLLQSPEPFVSSVFNVPRVFFSWCKVTEEHQIYSGERSEERV